MTPPSPNSSNQKIENQTMAKDEIAEVPLPTGMTEGQAIAEMRFNPLVRNAVAANAMAAATVKFNNGPVSSLDASAVLKDMADKVAAGNLRHVSDSLFSQSVLMDTTATELMRRAWLNVSEYPDAFQRYMNLALKAQAQSRTSLEALARLHQPREQIVRHVHVNEGGQAIVADQVTIGGPGGGNAAIADQSHTARTADVSERAALPSPDPLGNGVPIPGGTREAQMQDARRDEPRRAPRKRQRAQARAQDGRDGPAS